MSWFDVTGIEDRLSGVFSLASLAVWIKYRTGLGGLVDLAIFRGFDLYGVELVTAAIGHGAFFNMCGPNGA